LKICCQCKIPKELSQFYKATSRKDGHGTRCIECSKIYQHLDYQINREKRDATRKIWREKHPGHEAQRCLLYNQSPRGKYRQYKTEAKSRNLLLDLTFEEFMTFWQRPCSYCGEEIKAIGLDRVDNTKGYSIDNCVSCCGYCNWMKKDLSVSDWIKHLQQIVRYFNLEEFNEKKEVS
jgi:hypothetical protein